MPRLGLKINLDEITLAYGSHKSPDEGMCAMELVSFMANEPFSDRPACVSPVIGALVRCWNDGLKTTDRNRLLKPLLPRLIGTVGDEATEQRRSWMALDWMIRQYAPAWLRLAKLEDAASALESLAEVDSAERARAVMPALKVAQQKADAARDAAWAAWAAWAAAGAAAAACCSGVKRGIKGSGAVVSAITFFLVDPASDSANSLEPLPRRSTFPPVRAHSPALCRSAFDLRA